jgi:hypothetical protein
VHNNRVQKIDSISWSVKKKIFKLLKRFKFFLVYIPLFVLLPYYLFNKSEKAKVIYEFEECGYLYKKFERNKYTTKGRYVGGNYAGTLLIFVVKYPNRFVEINVTPNTYYNKEVNDRVCFLQKQEGYLDNVLQIKGYAILLSIISGFVLIYYILYKLWFDKI